MDYVTMLTELEKKQGIRPSGHLGGNGYRWITMEMKNRGLMLHHIKSTTIILDSRKQTIKRPIFAQITVKPYVISWQLLMRLREVDYYYSRNRHRRTFSQSC